LLVDKPVGPTSHDIVAVVRRAAATRRVGHAGTLDPFASGLLAVLVGRATRLAPFLVGLPKTYTGTIRLGAVTDTDDREGTVLREDPSWQDVTGPALAAGLAALTGRVRQRPPDYSAKKVAGTPAYRRARRGHPVTLAPQEVEVHRFVCTGRDGPDVHFEAEVSSGTYIRALARDLGESLGCGAHLAALRRTAIGPFVEADAVPASALEPPLPLRPARDAVPHLPARSLTADEAAAVRHGGAVALAADAPAGPTALLVDGHLLAIALPQGDLLRPRVVLDA
jgi:tRNA pseudouridine55 synthase